MTTPKPPTLAMWTAIDSDAKQPFRELAEEFRRLAAEAKQEPPEGERTPFQYGRHAGMGRAYDRAAQMLEERLNG